MPTIKKDDIITHTHMQGGLRVAIGERLLTLASFRPVAIPRSYRGKRVGVELVVRGRPLPAQVNARLLSTAYDVFVHQDGTASIPFETVQRRVGYRAAISA